MKLMSFIFLMKRTGSERSRDEGSKLVRYNEQCGVSQH